MDSGARAEWQLIRTLSVLVIGLGAYLYQDLGRLRNNNERATILKSESLTREPASVVQNFNLYTHKISCLEEVESLTIPIEVKRIRLKGSFCSKQRQPSSLRILNLSNGFVGSVFVQDQKHWSSDFIDLDEGSNSLQMTLEEPTGKKTITGIQINRNQI